MTHRRFIGALSAVLVLIVALAVAVANDSSKSLSTVVAEMVDRDSVTIVVTDSGLGGLSVAAEIERRLQSCRPFLDVQIVFANALPSNDHTYNSMATTDEKVATFSSALDGIANRYHPDLILIACNTLSVVYPHTTFYQTTSIPVFGIVDFGVDLIVEQLGQDEAGSALILGTPTTAESGAHRDGLLGRGIAESRITVQACDMLESEIQADPGSDMVHTMIEMYAGEALERVADSHNLAVALCCTHYGYARTAFQEVISTLAGEEVTVLDPNTAMSEAVFAEADCRRFDSATVTVRVISRAVLGEDDIAAIAGMLEACSSVTAEALRHYTFDTTLFLY